MLEKFLHKILLLSNNSQNLRISFCDNKCIESARNKRTKRLIIHEMRSYIFVYFSKENFLSPTNNWVFRFFSFPFYIHGKQLTELVKNLTIGIKSPEPNSRKCNSDLIFLSLCPSLQWGGQCVCSIKRIVST